MNTKPTLMHISNCIYFGPDYILYTICAIEPSKVVSSTDSRCIEGRVRKPGEETKQSLFFLLPQETAPNILTTAVCLFVNAVCSMIIMASHAALPLWLLLIYGKNTAACCCPSVLPVIHREPESAEPPCL